LGRKERDGEGENVRTSGKTAPLHLQVLNTMGTIGYRVAGSSPAGPEGHVWTLERRGREIQESSNGDRRI